MADQLTAYQNGDFICTLYSDGTFVKESIIDNPQASFPSTIDIKITNYCDLGCPYCHEDSTIKGKHGDLDKLTLVLSEIKAGVELAIGGGNPLAHPDLYSFLEEMRRQGKYCNITVNQGHLQQYQGLIEDLLSRQLIRGIGVSITRIAKLPEWLLKAAKDNLVLHMILGIHTKEQLQYYLDFIPNAKILLLGYKSEVGRGRSYYNNVVDTNIKDWIIYVRYFFDKCVLSFDNLAIEQLKLKRFFSMDAWSKLYMGDDFTQSMYIDAVEEKYAPTSRSLLDCRQSFNTTTLLNYWKENHGITTYS